MLQIASTPGDRGRVEDSAATHYCSSLYEPVVIFVPMGTITHTLTYSTHQLSKFNTTSPLVPVLVMGKVEFQKC
jgi:hypothetical protein